MQSLSRRTRFFCLLALLQLAGGPLVLTGVVTLSKVVVKHSIQHGLVAGISKAVQSEEWQAACDKLVVATKETTGFKSSGDTPKPKDGKPNLVSIAWMEPPALPEVSMRKEPRSRELKLFASAWPQAPPVPPPRAV